MSNIPNHINNLSGTQLDNYIINELYKKINDSREMFKIPKLYPDSSAQTAIQNILIDQNNYSKINENDIEPYLIKENFVAKHKIILNFQNSKPKTNLNNKTLLETFYSLIDENCINTNMPLISRNYCYTHIGLNIKYDEKNGIILIVIILSQKIISVDNSYTLKDGYVITGSILLNNCFIAGAKIKKNDKISYDIGPRNLTLNTEKTKYGIILPNVNFKDLIIRKIMCYCIFNQLSENIPYLDPNARAATVQFNNLELGVCQIINFKEGISDFNQLNIQDFLKKEFGIDVNVSSLTHNKNNNNNNNVMSLVQRLNQGKNNNQNILNNNNINNINNQNVILTPSRNNNNLNNKFGNVGIMSAIPEEKNNLNKSFFFSNKNFIGSPIPKNINNNDFLGSLNNKNSNIQNIIGSKLQRAEELNGNINNIKIDNNKVSPFNINNNDFSFSGNSFFPNNQNNNIINQNNNNIINQNNNNINQNN